MGRPGAMSGVVAARTAAGASERAGSLRAAAAIVALLALTLVLHFVWLERFRRGYVTEFDESGYMQFALGNFDALHDSGPWVFLKTVAGRGTFGPLLPFVASLAYPIVGRSVFGGLLVMPLFFTALVCAAFGLARQLVSDTWAVLAALAVASIPAVTDYARLFHFALPATACMTAALWALVRSDGLRRARWAAAFGVFVALTLLARTMTLAYVPGLALAAAAQLLVAGSDVRSKVRNLAIAAGATAIVAGPWYVRNARSVYDALAGSGYGEGATAFGRHYPILSWGYWTKELRLDLSYLWLPLAGTLLLCFAVALGFLASRRRGSIAFRPRTTRGAALLGLALVVAEGYLALTSSRNEGTGFSLPWLPALVILATVAAASVPARPLRIGLAALLVVVSGVALASKSGWIEPLAKVRTVGVPGLGRPPVTDGRGIIQLEVAGAGYDVTPVTHPLAPMHRRWLPLARDVVGWSLRRAERRGESLHLTLGLDDLILSNSRFILAAQLYFHRFLPVDYLKAFPEGDTVASYRRQLAPENALVSGDLSRRATVTRSKVEAAARSLGFVPVKSFTLPDRRTIWVWWRERAPTG